MKMIISMLILAVSLSLDALGVGIAYGMKGVRVPLSSKMVICAFSILYSLVAILAGKSLADIFPPYASKIIGTSILLVMGLWIILQSLLKKDEDSPDRPGCELVEKTLLKIAIKSLGITIQVIKNPAKGDIDKSGIIDFKESLLLGLALSVDAIGVGIGCAFTGFDSMSIPFAIGLFQLIFLFIGTFLGGRFRNIELINKRLLSFAPGFLLICLALLRIY